MSWILVLKTKAGHLKAMSPNIATQTESLMNRM